MRIAAGAVLVLVAMSAVSARGEDEPIDWEGKRDPFAYDFKVIWDPVRPERPNYQITEVQTQLGNFCSKAEKELLDGRAQTALIECDHGFVLLASLLEEDLSKFSKERDQLTRIRTAAERVYEREAAEKDFKGLNLILNGIVQSKQARAIINSKVVSCGELIEFPNSAQSVMITEIQKDKVIVRYRGFLMSVDLPEKG